MAQHPIEGLMKTAMENLKEMIDVNTIIGDPVEAPDGSVIIPVSKVGFGFAAGGTEFEMADDENQGSVTLPFGGGSGGGVSITPVAFLVVGSSGVKLVPLEASTHLYNRILDMTPQFVDKIQQMLRRNKEKDEKEEKEKIEDLPI